MRRRILRQREPHGKVASRKTRVLAREIPEGGRRREDAAGALAVNMCKSWVC